MQQVYNGVIMPCPRLLAMPDRPVLSAGLVYLNSFFKNKYLHYKKHINTHAR